MSFHNRRPEDCDLCELVRLLYPNYKADNSRASLLILKHLQLDHHIGVDLESTK